MTFLFISAYDSMNSVLAACAQEVIRKKHTAVIVISDIKDNRNNKVYFQKNLDVIPVDKFDYKCLDHIDVVISAPVQMVGFGRLFSEVRKRRIFSISFASLFSSVVMREYPDLVLCLGVDKFREFREDYLKYNSIAIGNPQYDNLVRCRKKTGASIKRVLIVDQGGYPYGETGKQQLADTLMKIAAFHSEKEFYIKPRYGKGESGRMTHGIAEQLIDYIRWPVDNLKVLDGSEILEDIMPEYDALITTWSTAYLDAIMMNIPLILIGGLDSVDVFDVRTERVDAAYRHLQGTGCLHDYQQLQNERIEFSYAEPSYIESEIYRAQIPCAERIVQLVEYLYENLLQHGLRITEHFEEDLDGFYQKFETFSIGSSEDPAWKNRREYLTTFNSKMQEWVYINRCMGRELDLSPLYRMFDMKFSRDTGRLEVDSALKMAEHRYEAIKLKYFSEEKMVKKTEHDRILQDFYFDWIHDTKQYEVLESYNGTVTAPESRLYNLALIELERNNTSKAYAYLGQFLESAQHVQAQPLQLLKEKRQLKELVPFCRGKHLIHFIPFALKK